jgi:hypothetical protein
MIDIIRKHYSKLSDDKLRELADDVLSLTEDGRLVLQEEYTKRGLPLARTIENIYKDQEEINKLIVQKCDTLRNLSCPICRSEEYLLNGILLITVKSFITVTDTKERFHLGCPNCLLELKREAEDSTSLLGWWGIFGIGTTLKALKHNDSEERELRTGQATNSLMRYASEVVHYEFKTTMQEINISVPVKRQI